MKLFLPTILLFALVGLTGVSALAQQVPPPTKSAPVAAPTTKTEVKVDARVKKVTLTGTSDRFQQDPPAPPSKPAPVAKPTPKVKVKVKVPKRVDDDDNNDNDNDQDQDEEAQGQTEQTVPTTSTVIVTLCGGSSSITVRGWDRNEVHAQIEAGESIEIKGTHPGEKPVPADRIEIVTGTSHRPGRVMRPCQSNGDIQLDVPRDAVLELRTNNGDVDVENVGRVRAESVNGSMNFRNITKALDASAFQGSIDAEKVRGPLNLRTISGGVVIRDAKPIDGWDNINASSVNGEVKLYDCLHSQVRAYSVSGELIWRGALADSGKYNFSTTSGDIELGLPSNSSFRVTARVASFGAVETEFALKSEGDTSFQKLAQVVSGTYGGGSAQIDLTSFNGTIRLRKK